jgi:hypothetical protein
MIVSVQGRGQRLYDIQDIGDYAYVLRQKSNRKCECKHSSCIHSIKDRNLSDLSVIEHGKGVGWLEMMMRVNVAQY